MQDSKSHQQKGQEDRQMRQTEETKQLFQAKANYPYQQQNLDVDNLAARRQESSCIPGSLEYNSTESDFLNGQTMTSLQNKKGSEKSSAWVQLGKRPPKLQDPTQIQWAFNMRFMNKANLIKHFKGEPLQSHKGWSEIQISEFNSLNVSEFYNYHIDGQHNQDSEMVEFYLTRFDLFRERINKKRALLCSTDNKAQLMESSSVETLAHYFRIQNQYFLLQEQEGVEKAYELFSVPKKDILSEINKINQDSADPRESNDFNNKKEDKKLMLTKILSLIDRYVFMKTSWHADIILKFEVVLSERMIATLETQSHLFNINHICMYIHLLSKGQNLLGMDKQHLASRSNLAESYRLQPHQEYLFTWLGFERLGGNSILGSAFVPRRVPQFKDGQFDGFKLTHFAMLLGVKIGTGLLYNTEFQGDLPIDRLECFQRDKICISRTYLSTMKNKHRLFDIEEFFDDKSPSSMEIKINGLRLIMTIDDHRRLIKLNSWDLKESMVKKYLYQNVQTYFRNNIFKFNQIEFLGERHLYSKNLETGFWEYNQAKATTQSLHEMVSSNMPSWYAAGVREFYQKESLVMYEKLREENTLGKSSLLRQETLEKLESYDSQKLLAQVLQMLPTLQITLNSEQQKIMEASTNLFILGRSGTGKTTTTVLRFFCQEILYMAIRKQQKVMHELWCKGSNMIDLKEQQKLIPKLNSQDVQENTSVRMVFVTASPVLTNEVKQYYSSLKQQLQSHLHQQEQKQKTDISSSVREEGEDKQKLDHKKLLALLEIKEKEILQADQLEQQLQLPESFSKLKTHHFPLFLTVQRMVYMLDASLQRSFFSRSSEGKIIGMESSLGWHSEDQGVFMINQDFKHSEQLNKELQEFELNIMSSSGQTENQEQHIDLVTVNDPTMMDIETYKGQNFNDEQQGINNKREGRLDQNYREASKKRRQNQKNTSKKRKNIFQIDDMPMCQEITFEVFEERFIQRFYRFMSKSLAKKMSPSFIWTEIMSVIKGSIETNSSIQRFLSKAEYRSQGSPMLNVNDKNTLYYLFLRYEEWKLNIRGFDFLDVVNHINQEFAVNSRYYNDKQIDYLIVDEVQDLYPKTLKLLLQQTRYKVVFAGDTAQTIAKGVSARISDMNNILQRRMKLKTQIINLSVNYRSQNSILQLANCVVKLLSTVFPNSIDQMTEEVSQRLGPKPYLVAPMDDELLCHYFFGKNQKQILSSLQDNDNQQDDEFEVISDEEEVKTAEQEPQITKLPHFGASQVVIVRDQSVKAELPEFMKSMLCLTVYESKGLEFDDVILFNFFAMGEIKSQLWKLLHNISANKCYREEFPDWVCHGNNKQEKAFVDDKVQEVLEKHMADQNLNEQETEQVDQHDDNFMDQTEDEAKEQKEQEELLEQLIQETKQSATLAFRQNMRDMAIQSCIEEGTVDEFISEWNYNLNDNRDIQQNREKQMEEIQRKYYQLCTELKFFYVAITRPKNRLFIYDENIEDRKPIEDIFGKINAVQWVTRSQVQKQLDKSQQENQEPQTIINTGTQIPKTEALLGTLGQQNVKCDKDSWKFQGLRFMKQKNYEQAVKCFRYAGTRNLVLRCKAYISAKQAQDMQVQNDSETWEYKRKMQYLSKTIKKENLAKLKIQRIEACRLFHLAGLAFERADMTKFAASCYFTARSYSKAAEIFKLLEMWSQAGECIACIGKNRLKEAAGYFEKGGLILRAIECYEQINDWEPLLHCLNRNQDKFGDAEKQSLVKKYVPIALNNIYSQHGMIQQAQDVPLCDQDNLGKKVQAKIQEKYKVKDEAVIEEALDEYGEELVFNEDDDEDSTEEPELQNSTPSGIDIDKEQEVNCQNSSEEEDINVGGFGLNTIIKEKYASKNSDKLHKQEQEKAANNSPEEIKHKEESFEVINSDMSDSEIEELKTSEKNQQNNGQTDEKVRLNMTDSFDHLSQYDPDDQFIKSDRSISIIESYMFRDGDSIKGKQSLQSQSSEFSIISSPKLQSIISSQERHQISFIDHQAEDDNYMQDVVAQKIIYYLSLWSEDMRNQLSDLKRRGILHENNTHVEQIDQADFIIQMDDVDQDFVNLILDTLELYEFYHMSLMMCKRYHLQGRQGRYLVLMCSKYSNLNDFRSNFMQKLHSQKFLKDQNLCSLLAHEAIHNVLCLIDSNYLKMKPFGEQLTDENSLGLQTYKNMLNLGFWKKLVYIIDKKQALHLCLKFFDFKNFQLIMKAFMTQEERLTNRILLEQWTLKTQMKAILLEKRQRFSKMFQVSQLSSVLEELAKSELIKADQLNQRQMLELIDVHHKISEYFQATNQSLNKQERQQNQAYIMQELDVIFNDRLEFFGKNKDLQSDYLQKYSAAVLVFDICFDTLPFEKFQKRILRQIVGQLSCFKTIYGLLNDVIDKTHASKEIIESDPVLEALYSAFQISYLDREDFSNMQSLFDNYSAQFMLMNINSPIMKEVNLIQSYQRDNDIYKFGEALFEKTKRKYFTASTKRYKIEEKMKNINIDQSVGLWKCSDQRQSAFVADMDAQFIFVPKKWIHSILRVKIAKVMVNLIFRDNEKGWQLDQEDFSRKLKLEDQIRLAINDPKDYVQMLIRENMIQNNRQYSEEWQYLKEKPLIDQKVALIRSSSGINNLVYILQRARIRVVNLADLRAILVSQSLLKNFSEQSNLDNRPQNGNIFVNSEFQKGLSTYRFYSNKMLNSKLAEDQESIVQNLLKCFQSFSQIDHYIPFLELCRATLKKMKKVENSPYMLILKECIMRMIDCHVFVKNGQWSFICYNMLALGESRCLQDILSLSQKVDCLEFAAYTTFMLKFGLCYAPDYVLHYIDSETNFKMFYSDDTDEKNQLKGSIAQKEKKDIRNQKKAIKSIQHKVKSGGRHVQGFIDDFEDEEYYSEQYHAATDDYYEDQYRPIFEKKIDSSTPIQKLEPAKLQRQYELMLSKLVQMLDRLNADERTVIYQAELQRIYNMLMTVVVNDKNKSKRVSELLGQGFNRLVNGPYDEYFIELGVPQEWYDSSTGLQLSNVDFEDQVFEFDQAEEGLKYQWFNKIEENKNFFTIARGTYIAKIDITEGLIDQNQLVILKKESQSILFENRQLALRKVAALMITRAVLRYLRQPKRLDKKSKMKKIENQETQLMQKSQISSEKLQSILQHAQAWGLIHLTKISQIDIVGYISQLISIQQKCNYLQELMIVKAFVNSMDISKAVHFMAQLSNLLAKYQESAKQFALENADILNSFDMMEDENNQMDSLLSKLIQDKTNLEQEIDFWLKQVYQGESTSQALKTILETKTQSQQRLKLKWKQIQPNSGVDSQKRRRLLLLNRLRQ